MRKRKQEFPSSLETPDLQQDRAFRSRQAQEAQERVSSHLFYMAEDVEPRKDQPPRTFKELEAQRMFADAAMHVALGVVCELLPAEIQPTVKRLLDQREAIWHRHVERETGGKS